MLTRRAHRDVLRALRRQSAVALLGPRQCGKTTLAHQIARASDALYLDLADPGDLARLADARAFLRRHRQRLVILDEVHHAPEIFATLRGLIDEGRRQGIRTGRFLVLGSASFRLLRQSAETLTGRVAVVPLGPLNALEVGTGAETTERLWLRGGFPDAFLARNDRDSLDLRRDMLAMILGRDLPEFGAIRLPIETLRRFLTMLAHQQGGPVNRAALAAGLGIREATVSRALDRFDDLLLVRRIEPWTTNVGKRLRKAPRILLRDSGLVHALLNLRTLDDLLGHPVCGPSWEAFVIENLLAAAPPVATWGAYRTLRGAECDFVIEVPPHGAWAIEVSRSTAPRLARGFHHACEDIRPARRFVVHPGENRFDLASGVEAIPLPDLMRELAAVDREGSAG